MNVIIDLFQSTNGYKAVLIMAKIWRRKSLETRNVRKVAFFLQTFTSRSM